MTIKDAKTEIDTFALHLREYAQGLISKQTLNNHSYRISCAIVQLIQSACDAADEHSEETAPSLLERNKRRGDKLRATWPERLNTVIAVCDERLATLNADAKVFYYTLPLCPQRLIKQCKGQVSKEVAIEFWREIKEFAQSKDAEHYCKDAKAFDKLIRRWEKGCGIAKTNL